VVLTVPSAILGGEVVNEVWLRSLDDFFDLAKFACVDAKVLGFRAEFDICSLDTVPSAP
jgi:hypothetical protein